MRIALAVAVALLVAGCSSGTQPHPAPAPTAPTATTARPAAPPARCAWYTATSDPAGTVSVVASGPACRDRSLIEWLTSDTDRPWTSEGVIPGSMGTELANFTRNGSTAEVWFTGPPVVTVSPAAPSPSLSAPPAAELAGRLADALMASGWQSNPNN